MIKILFLASLLFLQVNGIEFYYTLKKNTNQCFEQYLSGQTLMTGEINFVGEHTISLTIEGPEKVLILSKVSKLY